MSEIKSFAVGNGDMFYILHGSDNFTIIDCCLSQDNASLILNQMKRLRATKSIARFISTHPDEDHIRGLEFLEKFIGIENFYCVKNAARKKDPSPSFLKYCELRDDPTKVFHISRGVNRKWMNQADEDRGSSGISILWPDPSNVHYRVALEESARGASPNNISAIVKYSLEGGATFMWMGDLETEFMEEISNDLVLPKVNILFAPHHGRNSGRIPQRLLRQLSPEIIIVGESPSEYLHYYPSQNTITQNWAGDIVFRCEQGKVHIFTSEDYEVDFLQDEQLVYQGMRYLGTLQI